MPRRNVAVAANEGPDNEGPDEAMPVATTEDAAREDVSLWGRFWRALTGRA